jgi:hypothetical protein
MMTDKLLSNEESKFLCNSIIRLHKENGCLKELKENFVSSERLNKHISSTDIELSNFLIEPVWKVVYKYHLGSDGDFVSRIIASMEMLKFIDMIRDSKYSIIRTLSESLAGQELKYLKSTIDEILDSKDSLSEIVPMEIVIELKKHYKNLCSLNRFDEINLFEE